MIAANILQFNFSAYLGVVLGGFPGAIICWIGIFAPGLILIAGIYPFWVKYRRQKFFKDALVGINAAAIGLVIAAVYILYARAVKLDPFLTTLAILTMAASGRWDLPAPLSIILSGLIGAIKYQLSQLL